jgi:peroxiredoxin
MVDVSEEAPDFTLKDTGNTDVTLGEQLGEGPVVLAFYPAAFTGVCTDELCSFRDSLREFENLNAKVLAISTDSPFANAAFREKHGYQFPLLSDPSTEVVQKYGVAWHDFLGVPGFTVATRSVFVLDKDGVIRYKWVTDDQGVPPDMDEVTRAVRDAAR